MEHIRLLATDVTVLAITHRRSVITQADKIIDLIGGGLAGSRGRDCT